MATNYPGSLDTFDTIGASDEMNDEVGTRTHREMHNDANDAIEAIEAELGTNPSGAYDTVAARLASVDVSTLLVKANNLSDIANTETARTNLGLGTMATATASDYLSKAGNLSGIADPAAARINLGLGSMATASASAYAALAGTNTFTAAQTISANADTVGPMLLLRDTSANAASRVWRISNAMGSSPYGALGFQVGATAGGTPVNEPKLIILSDGKVGVGITTPTSLLHVAGPTFIDGSTDVTQLRVQGVAGQSQPLVTIENSSAGVLASITAAGLHRWNSAGNEQTTVGAAGGASALPGAPTKYLKVVDSSGATLVIPAYAAA